MDLSGSPATQRKLGFGLKGKKKKKVNTDLVLANKGAVDSDVEVPSEASSLPEGENTEDQPGSSGVVRTRVIPNYKRYEICTLHSAGKSTHIIYLRKSSKTTA